MPNDDIKIIKNRSDIYNKKGNFDTIYSTINGTYFLKFIPELDIVTLWFDPANNEPYRFVKWYFGKLDEAEIITLINLYETRKETNNEYNFGSV